MKSMRWIILLSTLTQYALEQNNDHYASTTTPWLKDFYTGAVSGTTGMVAYSPFHYAQNRRIQRLDMLPQTSSTSILNKSFAHLRQIMSGSRALIFGKVPSFTVQQVAYAEIIRRLESKDVPVSEKQKCAANIAAALLSAPIANASQLVALHQENQVKKVHVLKTVQSFPRGYKDLLRGTSMTIKREIIFMLTFNQLFPFIKNNVQKTTNNEIQAHSASALITGGLVAGFTQPLNVAATYLHADIARKQYSGFWAPINAIRDMAKKGILTESFKGLPWRAPGVMCGLAVMSKTKEMMQKSQEE